MKIDVTNLFLNFDGNYLVKTDTKRMQQVLLNLLSNAVKFTQKHGSIVIMVEKQKIGQKEMLRISVTDNGQGIKKKYQSKLFKMFGTFKDTKRGLNTNGIGLGLVISKKNRRKVPRPNKILLKVQERHNFLLHVRVGHSLRGRSISIYRKIATASNVRINRIRGLQSCLKRLLPTAETSRVIQERQSAGGR